MIENNSTQSNKQTAKTVYKILMIISSSLLLMSFMINIILMSKLIRQNNQNNKNNQNYIFTYNGSIIQINKYVYLQSIVLEIGSDLEEQIIIADALGNVNKVNGTMDMTKNKIFEYKNQKQIIKICANIIDNGNTIRYVDTNYIFLTKKEKVSDGEKCFYYLDKNNNQITTWKTELSSGIYFTITLH